MSRAAYFLIRGCLAAGLACAALAGCASDPAAVPQGLAIPAHFDGAGRTGSDVTRWWTRFGSKPLTALVAKAEAGNFDMAAAAARIEQADAQQRIAGAALLPGVTGTGNVSRSQSSGTSAGGGRVTQPSPRSSVSGVLAASYELDVWGRNRDILRAATSDAEASVYAREVVRLTTQAGVVNAFLQLAAARGRLAIANENLRDALRVLGVLRERLAAGTGNALEVAQQESLVATQRAAIPVLRQNADIARTTIALLLGRPPEGFALAAASLDLLRTPSVAPGLPALLLTRRPDLRNIEALLAGDNASVEAARKALLPSIQLTGQGGLQSAAFSTLLRPESAIWTLAAGITQPIFDGGRLRAQVALSEAQRLERLELYRKAIISALVDVENALTAIRESAAREAAQRVAVAKGREAFRFAEQRLREGTIDLQALLNTQTTLFQAQDALVQDRLSRLQSAVSLFQALGGDFAAPLPAR